MGKFWVYKISSGAAWPASGYNADRGMMHAAPEDPQQARVGWSGGNPLAGIVSSAAARVQQAATPNKQQLFEQVKQPADVMTTKPFFQMPANKEQLSEQVKQSNVMATKPVVQTPKFGMLAVPSASSKPLPSLGDEHMSPADYAAYFTKDESRIRELITRIAKINEAYLRHSSYPYVRYVSALVNAPRGSRSEAAAANVGIAVSSNADAT